MSRPRLQPTTFRGAHDFPPKSPPSRVFFRLRRRVPVGAAFEPTPVKRSGLMETTIFCM